MRNVTISITFDEEKAGALRIYLEQKNCRLEDELIKSLETIYGKTVPANVREFLELRTGTKGNTTEKKKKPTSVSSPSVPERSDSN